MDQQLNKLIDSIRREEDSVTLFIPYHGEDKPHVEVAMKLLCPSVLETEIVDKHEQKHQPILSWLTHEHHYHERTWLWWTVFSLLIAAFSGVSAYFQQWILLVSVLVFGFFYTFTHLFQENKIKKVTLTDRGIKNGKSLIPFESIKHFSIIYDPPHFKTLHLVTNRNFFPEQEIDLNHIDPQLVKGYLSNYIPEIERKNPTISETITKLIKL